MKKNRNSKLNKKFQLLGFTLIELMVVVSVIAILSTLVLVTFYNVKAKTRDTRRVASITQLRDSLEAYYRDEGQYPATVDAGSSLESTSVVYMKKVPSNPVPWDDGACTSPGSDFVYTQTPGGISYTIAFCLGRQASNLSAGNNIATPAGIISAP